MGTSLSWIFMDVVLESAKKAVLVDHGVLASTAYIFMLRPKGSNTKNVSGCTCFKLQSVALCPTALFAANHLLSRCLHPLWRMFA
jgi:hypothetical protein